MSPHLDLLCTVLDVQYPAEWLFQHRGASLFLEILVRFKNFVIFVFGQCYIALGFSQVRFARVPLTDLVTAEGFLLLELAVADQCSLCAAFQSQTPPLASIPAALLLWVQS